MGKELFSRYVWLLETIHRAGKITFEEINARWLRSELSGGETLSLRTFHHHRDAIEELFDINIECIKRGGYCYYIEDTEELEKGCVRKWLLNSFAVDNLIVESRKLKSRILLEEVPSGKRYLIPLIEAMRDGMIVEVDYQSFRQQVPANFEIEPYCLKLFRQRWYVVARSPHYNRVMIYSLDRILDLEVSEKTFYYPEEFNPQSYFDACFGIVADDDIGIETVQLKVYAPQDKYFDALPLHHSQRTVEVTEGHTVYEYRIRPTYDFVQELLSHGADVEVLQPSLLRSRL
ncbi:WYL domain-containing protein, partial [Bacteroides fragilis]